MTSLFDLPFEDEPLKPADLQPLPVESEAPADGSVWAGGDCSERVVRGGHYSTPQPISQKRERLPADRGYAEVGFRVVRDL